MDDEEFELLTSKWQVQHLKDTCWPTCLKNIFDELASRTGSPELKIKMSKMDDLCGYVRSQGCAIGTVTPSVNDHLAAKRSSYRVFEKADRGNTLEMLKSIIDDEVASYPIIGVSPEYHAEQPVNIEGMILDHVLVVVAIDDGMVWFHDPYKPFAGHTGGAVRFKNSLPDVRMLKYWDEGKETRWAMWVQRPTGPLDKYLGMGAEHD